MRSYLLMMMAMVVLVACTTAEDIVKPVELLEVGVAQEPDYTVYSGNTNNTLITTLAQTNSTVSTRSAAPSRLNKKKAVAAPSVPAGAIDLWQAYEDFCVANNKISEGDRQWAQFPAETGAVYYVPSGKTVDCQIDMNNCDNFTVYVESGATWKFYGGNGSAYKYIYVLPGATLDWGYYSWADGQITVGNGVGADIKVWGTIYPRGGKDQSVNSITIKADSKLTFYEGDMEEITVTGNTFVENGAYLESNIPFTTGTISTNGGELKFNDDFLATDDIYMNSATKATFKCATAAKNVSLSGGNIWFYVNEALTVKGDLYIDGSKIYLNDALLDVEGTTTMYAKDNEGRIDGSNGSGYSVFRTKNYVPNGFQSTDRRITTLYGKLDVLYETSSVDANDLANTAFNDGVRLNSSEAYLPAGDCREEVGNNGKGDNDDTDPIVTPPATDPDPDPTDPDPTPAAKTLIGHIEINLHQNIHTDWNESKLSIHIRDTSDVEVFIPMPAEYICEADDMYIVQKHWEDGSYVYNSSPETVSMTIAGQTVTLTIEYVLKGDNPGIKVTTSGVNAEVLKACRTAFDDGLTFEVYNYYNYNILDEDGQITGTVTRDKIKSYLNQATVTFLNSGYPRAYINAFNVLDGQTEANPLDCKVTPTDDTNYPKSEDTGFHKNVIYWRGGTAPTE